MRTRHHAGMSEAAYDRYATAYRDWWAPVIAPAALGLLDRVEDRLAGAEPRSVVDVGTGSGTLALAALRRWPHAEVTGVDPSQEVMELARPAASAAGMAGRLRLLRGEAEALPLPDGGADLVTSSFAIQLTRSRAAATAEAFRVLGPGGTFACLTWETERMDFAPAIAFELAAEELDVDLPDVAGPEPRAYGSPRAAAADLRRAGFRRVRAWETWLEHRYSVETYLDVLEHWIEDDVFASLDEPMRLRLRDAVRRRLEQLEPEKLVWRRPLVGVVGTRPG